VSRKDYVRIAAMLADERALITDSGVSSEGTEIAANVLNRVTRFLADILACDNCRFDRQRFYYAADYDG